MFQLAWLVPALPLLGFILIGLLNKRLNANQSGGLASVLVLASFLISVGLFRLVSLTEVQELVVLFDWIRFGEFDIPFGFQIDRLSSLMLLIVTGIGFLIHVYSIGYMHHDADASRFFAYLNLFVFFMLLLVLGSNYLVMFIGWEGVGLCSYLLIGFWFRNSEYNKAAKKAFVMNRIGDLGLLLGLFLMFQTFGSLKFQEVFSRAGSFPTGDPTLVAITLLLFVGAAGKSAQIPLYTWLPDAMAGPTPVSALIHAATMVTAGIYMVIRSHALFVLTPLTNEIILAIAVLTALMAASIGLKQSDIKKVLAYSTVSQLGFMFAALGVGAYDTALFHVITHAFFKALLFLGAGSVIHAMSGEQDLRKMGGLRSSLPITHATFLVGTLAITGIAPFAGFFSKDEILAKVWSSSPLAFWGLLLSAALTTIYMFRLYFLTFHGEFRGTTHQREHLHESPSTITLPLIVLAVLSTLGGFIGIPEVFHAPHWLHNFLSPVLSEQISVHTVTHAEEWMIIGSALFLTVVLIAFTYRRYVKGTHVPGADKSAWEKLLSNKYYVDEIYDRLITRPVDALGSFLGRYIDRGLIDASVNNLGPGASGLSTLLSRVQFGQIGFYLFGMTLGIICILFLTLLY